MTNHSSSSGAVFSSLLPAESASPAAEDDSFNARLRDILDALRITSEPSRHDGFFSTELAVHLP